MPRQEPRATDTKDCISNYLDPLLTTRVFFIPKNVS